MEKVSLNYKKIDTDSIVKELKNNNQVNIITSNLKIDDDELANNFEKFYKLINTNSDCYNCINMENCKHSTKGLMINIQRDDLGLLTDSYIICNKYKDYYERKDNLIYSTLQSEEIIKESNKAYLPASSNLIVEDDFERIVNFLKNDNQKGLFINIEDSAIRLNLLKGMLYVLLKKHKVAYIKFSDFLSILKSEFKYKDNETLETINNVEILIIDGIGNESITTWSRDEILYSILDNRIQTNKATILASEYSIEDLQKVYRINTQDIKSSKLIEKIKSLRS